MHCGKGGDEECFGVGLAGCVWFGLIFMIVLFVWIIAKRTRFLPWTKVLPVALCVCLLEIPRYAMLIVRQGYSSPLAYAAHMFGSVVFFWFLSLIWFAWTKQLGPFQPKTAKRFGRLLLYTNILFDIVSVGLLLLFLLCRDDEHHHLRVFFESWAYDVLTSVDMLKNLALAVSMNFFIHNVLKVLKAHAAQWGGGGNGLVEITRNLSYATRLCIIFSVSRILMLALKIFLALKQQRPHHRTTIDIVPGHFGLRLFSPSWWLFSDLLPRGAPILVYTIAIAPRAYDRCKTLATRQNSRYSLHLLFRSMTESYPTLFRSSCHHHEQDDDEAASCSRIKEDDPKNHLSKYEEEKSHRLSTARPIAIEECKEQVETALSGTTYHSFSRRQHQDLEMSPPSSIDHQHDDAPSSPRTLLSISEEEQRATSLV